MLRRLFRENGPLMFHQSGGCCDGSSPMCYPAGEFLVSEGADVLWGVLQVDEVGEVPVYMSTAQFGYWKHTHLTIDLVPGRGAGLLAGGPHWLPVPDPLPAAERRGVRGAGGLSGLRAFVGVRVVRC